MSSGVEGPRPINTTVTTSEPTKTDEVDQEGRIPGGPSVKKEEVDQTTVKAGSDKKASPDKTIDDRTAQTVPTDEVTVEAATNHLELLSEAIDDDQGHVYMETPAQVPDELQWVTDDEVAHLSDVKTAFNPFESLKKGAASLKRALTKFVQNLRPNKEVVPEMVKAMNELAQAKMEQGASLKEATGDVAKLLEESPKAFLKGLEQQGLHDVVADLQDSFKVATAKNLAKMKSKLVQPEVLSEMKAVRGMSQEKAELIVNGALILAKLANAGGDKDASSIEGRGYLFGRIPDSKFELVKWVLDMDPQAAVQVLSSHPRLANTTFAADIRSLDRKANDTVLGPREFTEGPVTEDGELPATVRQEIAGSVEEIFESGALPMFERAEAEKDFQDSFNAFVENKKNSVLLERRERAGQRFKETGMAGNISEEIINAGIKSLKKTQYRRETTNNDALRVIAMNEKREDETGFRLDDVAQMAQHRTIRNKYKSGDALASDQVEELAGIYKDIHKEVGNLMKRLTEQGGKDLMSAENYKENARQLTNAIMVKCGYSVFTNHKSQMTITDSFHGAYEHDFSGMTQEQIGEAIFQNKAAMAQQALAWIEILAKEGPEKTLELLAEFGPINEAWKM